MQGTKFPLIRTPKLSWLIWMLGIGLGLGTVALAGDDETVPGDVFDAASDLVFNPNRLHEISITMNPNDLEGMRRAQIRDWREAQAVVFDGFRIDQVGIKTTAVRAEDPAFYTHPTLELDFSMFRVGQRLYGLRRLGIRSWSTDDYSLMIERLGMQLFGEFGLAASRTAHARVTINGQYFGPAIIEDRLRLDDLIPLYFPDHRGNLYKLQTTANSGEIGPNFDGFVFAQANPDEPATYIPYPFEPNGGLNPDGSDILGLIRALNRPTSAQVRAELGPLLDINKLIDYLAVDMALADTDGLVSYGDTPPYYFQNNSYFYHNPVSDQFTLIPNDIKGSMDSYDPDSVNRDLLDGWDVMNITRWMLNEPDVLDRYFQRVRTFINNFYIPDRVISRIDQMATLIRRAVYDDTRKPITNQQWEAKVESLRQYIRNRVANVRRQLAER
jgi:spore coat protein CotH